MSDFLTKIEGGGLKPRNIIQAAEADLKLMEQKAKYSNLEDKPYSFARKHVRRSKGSICVLLALALYDEAPATDKRSTMIIYSDRALLREALLLAIKEDEDVDRRET